MYILQCNARYGGEERLRNVTFLYLRFFMVKVDPLNVVSHNIEAYKNLSATLNNSIFFLHKLVW
jgi:hypothetical protein